MSIYMDVCIYEFIHVFKYKYRKQPHKEKESRNIRQTMWSILLEVEWPQSTMPCKSLKAWWKWFQQNEKKGNNNYVLDWVESKDLFKENNSFYTES